MKRYTTIKDYGVWIGDSEKVDKIINEVLK